uniref:CHK kinase-like domain-containing protein n=1 Tax=Fibrocapsa japonica TaxID=94617 RepID=A0A7S2UTP8_9STRA|mmetsp:Transcript_12950/g.19117  ORF Transcript_12950/g.19117 Transcript_12950/m.19117 type:complete len:376 (+) Transcript_12950:88-1215(+)|eukprot:CAMPEP_0113937750 /NCGR_PEP_ID=MMETSP1339-20121228/4303_1 /TAXON_ID=94617 /ORGANISM="Fibrocapsa japonica" /LENGTH=375 /DNA_ID=CAMNT_0000940633 /DNA_START=34 /DNA_END=1161 /DNA_ORIENTATION=- /assembly_acc=CAM_ASM_000762
MVKRGGKKSKNERKDDDEVSTEMLSSALGEEVASIQERRIQSLWAGYGTISRLHLSPSGGTVIVKRVMPPRGEDGVSHQRKLHSYQVEAEFYRSVAPRFLEAVRAESGHQGGPLFAGVPTPHHVSSDSDRFVFVLSDLEPLYPEDGGLSKTQTWTALKWLAAFHACFWEADEAGLWAEGSYWHFETRQDEWHSMGRSWARLHDAAPGLDRRIQGLDRGGGANRSRRNRTLVHGDPKSANIMCTQDGNSCGMYDFQYCGGGFGSRDLVYMLVSSCPSRTLDTSFNEMLQFYHDELCQRLPAAKAADFPLAELEMQFDLCLLDYVRFMAGWGMWGNTSWANRRADQILTKIDGGKAMSPDEYTEAIYQLYPLNGLAG